jgi:acid phosphatase (class A)
LLDRVGTGALVDPVKSHYMVRRPFVGTQAPLCEPRTDHLMANGDYPSGHAANGWLEALILASLLPEHATAVLARGRAYGESRFVCGSHSAGAVEGGWMAGSAMFAALMGQPEFRQDLESARQELSEVSPGTARPDPARCLTEWTALADKPW